MSVLSAMLEPEPQDGHGEADDAAAVRSATEDSQGGHYIYICIYICTVNKSCQPTCPLASVCTVLHFETPVISVLYCTVLYPPVASSCGSVFVFVSQALCQPLLILGRRLCECSRAGHHGDARGAGGAPMLVAFSKPSSRADPAKPHKGPVQVGYITVAPDVYPTLYPTCTRLVPDLYPTCTRLVPCLSGRRRLTVVRQPYVRHHPFPLASVVSFWLKACRVSPAAWRWPPWPPFSPSCSAPPGRSSTMCRAVWWTGWASRSTASSFRRFGRTSIGV